MAATTGNAIKALIESLGLGLAAYRDGAPDNQLSPYVTILDGLAVTPDDHADGGTGGTCTETVQVDLWEDWQDADGNVVESPVLAPSVVRGLHGAKLDSSPNRVHGVVVVSKRRLLEPDTNTVHTAITANVRRDL